MSIRPALEGIAARLGTITAPPGPLRKIYPRPREATSLGEFPCAVLGLAPQVAHQWGTEAAGGGSGLARHDYQIAIWLFVGARGTGLPELHDRVIDWPETIARALVADIMLSGRVLHLGDGSSERFLSYQYGPLEWGDQQLFGLRVLVPVVEKTTMEMN